MDPTRFDDLARRLARPLARRRLLGAIAGVVTGPPLPSRPARADHIDCSLIGPGWFHCDGSGTITPKCCGAGTACCGGTCCSTDTGFCADADTGLCCGLGEVVCQPGSCCDSCPDGLEPCNGRCVLACGPNQGRDPKTCACGCLGEQCGTTCCPFGRACADPGDDESPPKCCAKADICGINCKGDLKYTCCKMGPRGFSCPWTKTCCAPGRKGDGGCCLKGERCDRGRCVRTKKR